MSATGNSEAGYTLIETLVVMGLVALITAISFPVLERLMAQASFRESAAIVVAELRVAHAAALHASVPVTFNVAAEGDRFGINNNLTHALPDGVTIRMQGSSETLFFPDGSSSGGVIMLTGAQREMRLRIDEVTGQLSGLQP